MKHKLSTIVIALIVSILILAGSLVWFGFREWSASHAVVKGTHGGEICYYRKDANKHIEYPAYYRTMEECPGKPYQPK